MAWPAREAVAAPCSTRALAVVLPAGASPAFWKMLAASEYTPIAATQLSRPLVSMGTRPPTLLAGSPSVGASAGGSPTVIDSTPPWSWPSLADQPEARTGRPLGGRVPVGG